MDNNTVQLNGVINSPVTGGVPIAALPDDTATANPTDIMNQYNESASGFNLMGESLAKDVAARQELLIGNNLGPSSSNGVGDYNYDRYYETGLASGSNAIRTAGTSHALQVGMEQAQRAAEERSKKAQKNYNDYVARKQAEAAAAQAAAEQQRAKASVMNVEMDAETLRKHGGLSAEDLYNMSPAEREKAMRAGADQAAGVNNENVWKWREEGWYSVVDKIYDQFGATAQERQDERSGNQTEASKKFWGRSDVGNAFSSLSLSNAGFSPTYIQDRNQWISSVNNKVTDLVANGSSLQEVSKALSEIRMNFQVKSNTAVGSVEALTKMQAQLVLANKEAPDTTDIHSGNREKLKEITKLVNSTLEATRSGSTEEREAAAAEAIQKAGYASAAEMQQKVNELASKSGAQKFSTNKTASKQIDDFMKKTNAGNPNAGFVTVEMNGLDFLEATIQLTAENIAGIGEWKRKNPEQFNRYQQAAVRVASSPVSMSQGDLIDLDGNYIPAGTTVIYQAPGADELLSYKKLKEALEQKPVIYDDGSGQFGWADYDGLDELYNAYLQEAAGMEFQSSNYGWSSSGGAAKAFAFNAAFSPGLPADHPSRSKEAQSAANKLKFGGRTINAFDDDKSIIKTFESLSGNQQREVYEALIRRAKYVQQGADKTFKGDGNFHGVVQDDISMEDAQGLLMILHTQQNSEDASGVHVGKIKRTEISGSGAEEFAKGFGVSFQQGVNFFQGAAMGLFGGGTNSIIDLISNSGKESQRSKDFKERSYKIMMGEGDGRLVQFSDGQLEDMLDVKEQENLAIFSGLGKYFDQKHFYNDIGGAAEFMTSIYGPGLVRLGVAGTKMAVGSSSRAIGKVLAKKAPSISNGITGAVGEAKVAAAMAKDAIVYQTKTGAGGLGLTSLKSHTMDIVNEILPSAARAGSPVRTSIAIDSLKSSVKASKRSAKVASDIEDIATDLASKGLFKLGTPDPKLSTAQAFFFKSSSRAQLMAQGASGAAFDSADRWTRGAAVALYNGGTDGSRAAAAKLLNEAHALKKAGKVFRPKDAFRIAAAQVERAGMGGIKSLHLLANEAKWTSAYVGWQFSREVGDRKNGKFANYLDENGNFDIKKAAVYQGQNILGDVVVASIGFGLLGPGLNMIKTGMYNRGLSKWSSILETAEEGTKLHMEAMAKVEKLSRKATTFALEAGARMINEGNSPVYRELASKASDASEQVMQSLLKSTDAFDEVAEAGIKSIDIDKLALSIDSKIGYNSMYSRAIASIKVNAANDMNNLIIDLPTLAKQSGQDNIRMVNEVLQAVKAAGDKATPEALRKIESDIFFKHGIPVKETQRYRRMLDESWEKVQQAYGEGNVTTAKGQGAPKMRKLYYPVSAMLTSKELNIPDAYLGIDIAPGIVSASKATLERDAIDQMVLYANLAESIDNGLKINSKNPLKAGRNYTVDEVSIDRANAVTGLHAYNNKLKSDVAVGRMRNARFGRGDVIKVVDDSDFDLMAAAGSDSVSLSRLNRRIRRAPEYQKLVDDVIKALSPSDAVVKATNIPAARTRAQAEAFLNNLVAGYIGPSEVRLLDKIAKGDKKLVDNFLIDHTALHIGVDDYYSVYAAVSKNNAIEVFTNKIGREPNKQELHDLGLAIKYRWSKGGDKAPSAKKTDAPITADTVAGDTMESMYESPATIFKNMEDAKDHYMFVTEQYSAMYDQYANTKFGTHLINDINTMDSSEVIGKEFKLLDMVFNDERISTMLATAPDGMAKKMTDVLENSKVVFVKGLKGNAQVKNPVAMSKLGDGSGYIIEVDIANVRKNGGALEASLGHENIHVYDLMDVANPHLNKIDNNNAYWLRAHEHRAHAFTQMWKSEELFSKTLDKYDDMIRFRSERLPNLLIAAEDAGVKLDYKKVVEEFDTANPNSAMRGENGIIYVRRSDFEGSEMSSRYTGLDSIGGGTDKAAVKNGGKISGEVQDGILSSVARAEVAGVNGEVFLDKQYADMIRTYEREGGDAFKKDGVLAKIATAANEIQQLQLAAGYSIYNAYTSRQFASALSSLLFNDPKAALELFETYSQASNPEAMRRFFSDPARSEFISDIAMVSGDTSLIDATIDVMTPRDSMRTGAMDDIVSGLKRQLDESAVGGKGKHIGRGAMDAIHRMVDDPTFKRFVPVLMANMMESGYKRRVASLGRVLDTSAFPGDRVIRENILKEVYEEHQMFWGLHVGTRAKKGGITKFNQDVNSKFLSGQARGNTAAKLLRGVFFALTYRLNMAARFLNGLKSLTPKNFNDPQFKQSQSLLFTGLAVVAAAQIWNYSQTGENSITELAAGLKNNDPNNLTAILRDFGTLGRFNLSGSSEGLQLDPFFSVFTMQNSIAREAMAAINMFTPPERDIKEVQPLGQELASLTLSPIRAIFDLVGGTYYGYSVWGEGASAIDDETGEPIPYSPLDNAIAISSHLLGLDNFGIGVRSYEGGEVMAGRNARGESIMGSGLLQHEYISAYKAFKEGDVFTGITTALELPFRNNNITGRAKADLNGHVMRSGRSFKAEYDKKMAAGMSKEEKDAAYKEFATKLMEQITIWNDKYKVLEQRPALLQAAQRVVIGFLADEFDEKDNRIKGAYWAAGIDALGGFDKKKHESDEEYEKRKEQVSTAYKMQLDKEYAARNVLRSLGYNASGFDFDDERTKLSKDRDAVTAQFKKVVNGEIYGQKDLKTIYEDYNDRIRAAKNIGNKTHAAELEQEYISIYDSVVAPYMDEFGAGTLIRNRDFIDIAKKYVMVPSKDFFKYSGENGKRYWLQDRYGVGYKNGSALIADAKYMEAYNRMLNDTLKGNTALARAKAEEIVKAVASGRYVVSDKEYNNLVQLFSKLRQNIK